MRIISIINLKGGVGKTTTAINMAAILTYVHGRKVLLVDNDIQANATRFFERHSYDVDSMEDIYREIRVDVQNIIQPAGEPGTKLDIIPANMNMDAAIIDLMKDKDQEQTGKLRSALKQVENDYDFCIVDNPPGVGMNVINALACTNDIIIPVKVDKYGMDGMEELYAIAEEMRGFNHGLSSVRGLITMYYKDPQILAGEKVLRQSCYEFYKTNIRYSRKVDAGSFETGGKGLLASSPRSAACIDYKRFVIEYLNTLEGKGASCHA